MIDHVRTLWCMTRRRECWFVRVYWHKWKLSAVYTWYDGPIFQVRAGPFWFALTH